MQKKFVNGSMSKKHNHLNIMNLCLSLRQVGKIRKKYSGQTNCFYFKDHGTTHCSIIDAAGNAVTVTSTINTEYADY